MPSKWCSASQMTSKPSSSESRASRRVSSMTRSSCAGSRLSGNRKLENFMAGLVPATHALFRPSCLRCHPDILELMHHVVHRRLAVELHLEDRYHLRRRVAVGVE